VKHLAIQRIACALLLSALPAASQENPPLAELDKPTVATANETLWCPDCLRRPILIEAHLTALGIKRVDAAGAPSDDYADLDLIIERPVPTDAQTTKCGPGMSILSNELTPDCYKDAETASREISTDSLGWYDVINLRGPYFQRESFYAAPSEAILNRVPVPKQSWCLTAYGEQARGRTVQAAAQIEILLNGQRRYVCTATLNSKSAGPGHRELHFPGCPVGLKADGRWASVKVDLIDGNACLRAASPWVCDAQSQIREPNVCNTARAR
jgi:hypothetical protein